MTEFWIHRHAENSIAPKTLAGGIINHYKLLIVSSEREKYLKMDKIPATTQIFLAQIMKFPDFSLTFLVFKNSLTNLQNSLTFPWPWRKIKIPWLFPDQWPPCKSFDPICPKTLYSLPPIPVMLHIKFDQDWPTGFRDIQVWKWGWQWTTMGGRLVYYKLRWAKNVSTYTSEEHARGMKTVAYINETWQ